MTVTSAGFPVVSWPYFLVRIGGQYSPKSL